MWKRAKVDVRLESDTAPALTFHVNCAGPKEDQEVAEHLAGQIALALSRIVSPYTASEKASLKKELDSMPRSSTGLVHIVFDGPPGPDGGRFVEVEDGDGRSISVGEWVERGDQLWELRIDAKELLQQLL